MNTVLRLVGVHPLTCRNRLRTLGRIAAWQIRSRVQDEVIVKWVGGTRLAVRRGMTGATGNVYFGLHEFVEMAFVLHLLRAGDVFVDGGANVGTYSVLASGVRGARAIAFEPDPDAAGALRRNLEINDITERVSVHEVAVGARDEDVAFTVGLGAKNRITKPAHDRTRSVPMRRIDTVIGHVSSTMMKFDLEGHEHDALRGAMSCLSARSLLAVQVEWPSDDVVRLLSSHGLERVYYEPFRRLLSDKPVGGSLSNAFFVRDMASAVERLRAAPPFSVLGQSI